MSSIRIGYVLKKFPRLSETFVLGELLAQEALGANIHVFSRRAPDDEPRHAELARLRADVEVLPAKSTLEPWSELFRQGRDGDLLDRFGELVRDLGDLAHPKLPMLVAEALYLLRRTRELEIEHLHVHFATDSALVALILSRLGGPSYSLTAHAKDIYRRTVDYDQLALLCEGACFVVTVCDANLEHMSQRLPATAAARIRRLYNGIDLPSFEGIERRPEPGHVLGVGRLVPKKGFDVLVEAVALLRGRGVDVRATLAGDGEERGRLEQLVAERGLGGAVRLIGACPQDEVRSLLARASLVCLPCIVGEDGNRDALPTVLLESLAAGVPTVSTPVTGVPEILDGGRAGLLVPERDPEQTAHAIERLLSDRVLYEQTAARGRERAAELFDRRRAAQVLHGWFEEALSRAAVG